MTDDLARAPEPYERPELIFVGHLVDLAGIDLADVDDVQMAPLVDPC